MNAGKLIIFAIPLALLGSEVTIFDISEDNKRYALEVAEAANVNIDFVVGDVLEINMNKYSEYFDVIFMEGGILHYFYDINQFMKLMNNLLKSNGKMICSDFHPFQKIADILEFEQPIMSYFSKDIIEAEMAHARFFPEDIRKQMPKCFYKKYTISEIINGDIKDMEKLKEYTFNCYSVKSTERINGSWNLKFKPNYIPTIKKVKVNTDLELDGESYRVNDIKLSPISIVIDININRGIISKIENPKNYDFKDIKVLLKNGSYVNLRSTNISSNLTKIKIIEQFD